MRIFGMDTPELLLIGVACVLLFGANKLPELGRSVATTIKEFKKSMKDAASDAATLGAEKPQK